MMGRKKKEWMDYDGLKATHKCVRLDRKHERLLMAIQARTGMTQGEIIREGIDMMGIKWHIEPSDFS